MFRSFFGGLAMLLLLAVPARVSAVLAWVEQGDAGSLPLEAQVIRGANEPLASIEGFLGVGDQDMFLIYIWDAEEFSATTVGGSSVDTQLFLISWPFQPVIREEERSWFCPFCFNGIYANDDTGGAGGVQSTLPAGHAFSPLVSGQFYLLAISTSNDDPLDAGGGLIFSSSPTTGVFGPIDDDEMTSWSGEGGAGGRYLIRLTGAVANFPEPGMLGLLGVGLVILVARRRS